MLQQPVKVSIHQSLYCVVQDLAFFVLIVSSTLTVSLWCFESKIENSLRTTSEGIMVLTVM